MIALQHAGTVDEVYTVGNTRSLPRVFDIEGLQHVTLSQVACGEDYSLALTDTGEVYAWGDANYGKLAAPASADMPTDDDNLPYQPLPVRISGFGGCRLVQVSCGSNHSLALTEAGRVWAWGGAIFGRLGPADVSSMPLDEDGDPYQPTPMHVDGFDGTAVRTRPRPLACRSAAAATEQSALALPADLVRTRSPTRGGRIPACVGRAHAQTLTAASAAHRRPALASPSARATRARRALDVPRCLT